VSRRPDALLFDLGGVLVEVDWGRAFSAWSAASGVPAAALAQRFRRDAAYEAHECGALSDSDFFSALKESLHLEISDHHLLAGWNAILGEPFPGVAELLSRAAAQVPVHVFSNTNLAHVTHWRPRYRALLSPVSEVIVSCELGRRKPDPEAFRLAAARIGVEPRRIAFFDDLEENAAGARAAGMRGFHVRTFPALKEAVSQLGVPC
jgi:putative hydrolase of the HAD superfamily